MKLGMLHLYCSLRYPLMLTFQSMTSNVNIYQFDQHVIKVEYKKEAMSYPFWSRNLWDWAVDTIKHPLVGPHFVWDAQRLSKFDGKEWVRFVDEPWTANRFWDVQVRFQSNVRP